MAESGDSSWPFLSDFLRSMGSQVKGTAGSMILVDIEELDNQKRIFSVMPGIVAIILGILDRLGLVKKL
jgi:hypothetical protein